MILNRLGAAAAAVAVDECIKKEISLVAGGTTCSDFCGYGHREGESGDSMQALNVFCCDILASEPECFATEIA